MSRYGTTVNPSATPQNEKAVKGQKKNHAGGYVFTITPWQQFERFLVLGQIGPTYYASERKVVKENAKVIEKCIAEDGKRVIDLIVDVSDKARAPKNDPAIFALAIAAGSKDPETRKLALEALPKVCRIGTHLFSFADDVSNYRKWGRSLRNTIGRWYTSKTPDQAAYQAVKYQERGKWRHRDLLRLSHPKTTDQKMQATFRWIIGGKDALASTDKRNTHLSMELLPEIIIGFENAKTAETVKDIVKIIEQYKLPREAIPTKWLTEAKVWEAMLPHMGLTAIIRNLGKMSSLDMFKTFSTSQKHVLAMLTNSEQIKKQRVHPIQYLLANGVYGQGHGVKGALTWKVDAKIKEAIDDGFYEAFKYVEPTHKNIFLALDVSGSMSSGDIAGAPGITPRIGSAAMAMVTARTEKNFHMTGFTAGVSGYGGRWGGSDSGLTDIDIASKDKLDLVLKKVSNLPFGGTDCALPMIEAQKRKLEVDAFVIYTDSETWAGGIHPFQALRNYRDTMGRDAKLIVVGMTATEFSIADPFDAGMLDVVGFDTNAPGLMSQFIMGKV